MPLLYAAMALALILVGVFQSWTVALAIFNLCMISAIMALGVNIQWGYAGLFNVGIMGFAALGGSAAIIVSMPPVTEAWAVGWQGLGLAALMLVITIAAAIFLRRRYSGSGRNILTAAIIIAGYFAIRHFADPATDAIEAVNPTSQGYLGGMGLPVMLSWIVGGLFAAAAAYLIGRVTLGLRSDYLAIATLGISEIILSVLKNENWLTRGVKNVTDIPRPVPDELDLQRSEWFANLAVQLDMPVSVLSSIAVRGAFAVIFIVVLVLIMILCERALNSPWGRMMRAIRDNRDSAAAMGKDITGRHLQVFVLGSAVVGIAGAMLVTLDGQFTPTTYIPLRYTFLIWVMVIVGGSGNNFGAVLGGFVIWFVWIQAEPAGLWLMRAITDTFTFGPAMQSHLVDSAPHLRMLLMGVILLTVMRFSPRGLIPEKSAAKPLR
ncbi:branched-chain amino acid ABC transporter permease [Saliniramus fredricksonii]|nr:branched-chain amino acid ABC transporter permease [Saliniramus fredricksonii]SCC82055.1 amino acid/amide ABC transporter membrane protein 2, HAAT family [Saliniramus fredricksonii]